MPRAKRKELIEQLQAARENRLLITYITSTRSGHEIQIADDAFRLMFEHLEQGKELAKNGVDLFIHSNGGSGTVPWRIVSLVRQYTKSFAVLVPHRAFSAATLIALGANEIVMHKMGCLGPIDPSVANIFNPPHPGAPGQTAPISVEDVTAFFKLVKEEVGITHEDATNKVTLDPIRGAYIESAARADVFITDLRLERITLPAPAGPQEAMKQEALWQRWEQDS